MEPCVGTSGFSYKAWKGSFYPEDLPAKQMLRYYAEQLPAVEINNTFYRLPKTSVLESWAEQVPATFRFSIKASQQITHRRRLNDAREPTAYLLETTAVLEQRLGAVLFQLPPNLKLDLERFDAFLALLPDGTRATFEFRHESWMDDDVHSLLRGRGMALVCSDTDDQDEDAPIVETGRWGYLRLRRPGYGQEDLIRWADRLRKTSWERAFVFFKHEDAGAGPRMAAEFRDVFERTA